MGCEAKTYNKMMNKIRREYPGYSLARRKKIVNSRIYRKRK